ncbi:MAG: bifunctional serine/threonine-protein kinase/ABC transporter substrate-binding protein [Geitlerinemataceae cyanobacterium]
MGLNPGDILHDRYRIVKLLGQGGFGKTYLAEDTNLNDRLCAIKEIPQPQSDDLNVLEQARLRFDREVRALSQLGQHPQIPQVFDRLEDDNNFYLVQEYIEGNPLSDELTSGNRWEENRAIAFLQDILNILSFVHQKEVIHRDIKPSNLIRRSDGTIVLIDFGAVREIGTLTVSDSGETVTTTIGSPGYMPSEQQCGNPDFCSDIYAVGVTIIQSLIGVNPQRFLRDPETCEIIWIYATPDRPTIQISDRLTEIINKMVRYDFRKRYQSITEILPELERVIDSSRSPNRARFRRRDSPISRRLFLSVCGCGIGIIIAVIVHKLLIPTTCNLTLNDRISCGEELIIKSLTPVPKQKGVKSFSRSNYQESLDFFQQSWRQDKKDPETLIYMNNALLEAIDADYFTIAIAVPLRRNQAGDIVTESLTLEILRGVSQAQTEVNLSLLEVKGDKRDFPGRDFLEKINLKNQGLRVVIADDRNQIEKAKEVAQSLIDRPEILGVIGHYASDMTMEVVDIYNSQKLVLVSPGSTTNDLTENPRDFFFRTVASTQKYAPIISQYLTSKNIKKVKLFFNPSSPFTYSFQEDFKQAFQTSIDRSIQTSNLTNKNEVEKEILNLGKQPDVALVLIPDGEVTDSLANAIDIFRANNDRHWIATSEGLHNEKTLEAASKLNSSKKLVISTHWNSLNSQNSQFPDRSLRLWGGNVNSTTALAYDAARSLIEAIRQQQKTSRMGMQQTLRNPNFKAEGATGTIQFDPKTGDRQNPPQQLVHIVSCQSEKFGVTFVPIQYETAEAAGLKCNIDR